MGIRLNKKDLSQLIESRIRRKIDAQIDDLEKKIEKLEGQSVFGKKAIDTVRKIKNRKKTKDLLAALKAVGNDPEVKSHSSFSASNKTLSVHTVIYARIDLKEEVPLTDSEVDLYLNRQEEIKDMRSDLAALQRKSRSIDYSISMEETISNYINEMIVNQDPELEKLISAIESRMDSELTPSN